MRRRIKVSQSDVEAILHRYEEGFSLRQIAANVGCCPKTVGNILEQYGFKRRNVGRRAKWQVYRKIYTKCIECTEHHCFQCPNFKESFGAWGFTKVCRKCGQLFNLQKCPICCSDLSRYYGDIFILLNPKFSSFAPNIPPGIYNPLKVISRDRWDVREKFRLIVVRVPIKSETTVVKAIISNLVYKEGWSSKLAGTGLYNIYIARRFPGYIILEAIFGAVVDVIIEQVDPCIRRVHGALPPLDYKRIASILPSILPGSIVEIQGNLKGEKARIIRLSDNYAIVSLLESADNVTLKLPSENLKPVSSNHLTYNRSRQNPI